MQFRAENAQSLAKWLKAVQEVVGSKGAVGLEATPDAVFVNSTGGILGIRAKIPNCTTDIAGAAPIPATRVSSCLAAWGDGECLIASDSKALTLGGGKSAAKLSLPSEAVKPPALTPIVINKLSSDSLRTALTGCLFATTSRHSMQALDGVHLAFNAVPSFAGASDGRHMTMCPLNVPSAAGQPAITIPSAQARAIARFLCSVEGDVEICQAGGLIVIRNEDLTLHSMTMSGQYPNLLRAYPQLTDFAGAVVSSGNFTTCFSAVAAAAGEALDETTIVRSLSLTLNSSSLYIKSVDSSLGNCESSLDCELLPATIQGPVEVTVNADFVLSYLKTIGSEDKLRLYIGGSDKPLVIETSKSKYCLQSLTRT